MIATIPNIKGSDLSPELLRQVNISPEQIITITVKTETPKVLNPSPTGKKRKLEFLHNGIWDDENGETDLAENHDIYLYEVNPHNEQK